MPHYYIDTDSPEGPFPDKEGITLETVDQAHDLAMEGLADMVRDARPDGRQQRFTATIRGDSGTIGTATATVSADWAGAGGDPALGRALRAVDRAKG